MITNTIPSVWQDVVETLRERETTHDDWRRAWSHHLANWDVTVHGPRPIWFPDADSLANSGIALLMKASNHGNVTEFQDWSWRNPNDFWSAVMKRLDIHFHTQPHQVLSSDDASSQPNWFPGARMNIVRSCFGAPLDRTAIICSTRDGGTRHITYGELRMLVDRVVVGLRSLGIQPGDSVAMVMPMTLEAVAIYLGIIAAGCAVVSIADSFAAPEIAKRMTIASAKAVFCSGQVERLGKSIDLYSRIVDAESPAAIVVGENRVPLRRGDRTFHDMVAATQPEEEVSWHVAEPDDPTGILFSSGTTGDPKAIPWDHTTPVRCAADGLLLQDIREGDVVAWPTNLGWMMGPWLIYASLINRATMALHHDAPVGEEFGKFIEEARVTMLGVVPTMVRRWRKSKSMESCDWSNIRCFSSTGEASNADDMFYLSSLAGMKPVIEYCGGTEIGGGFISSTVLQPNVPGAFSTPAMGSRFVILNDDGEPASEGTLFLVPPILGCSRRLVNRNHHETYFQETPDGPNGELLRRHGDHFRRLKGGYYVAGGRVDDTMNLGGVKVSAAEIERAVSGILGISESAAIAVPFDESGPDQLVLFVVPENDCELTSDELLTPINKALRAELNPLFKASETIIVKKLPRTASNKVMRRTLRDQYRNGGSQQ